MSDGPSDEARADLRHAMSLQAAGDIDAALEAARRLLAREPAYGEAWAYVGNTLVTRKRHFADGIAALELGCTLRPDDPVLWYTLGWCREYAANAMARPKGGKVQSSDQHVAGTADALYQAAKDAMLHALTLDPDEALKGDIEDILDVIANVTGEPWTDEPHDRRVP
jgi:tetratricopeptide (TPR) repeat protein